MSVESIKSEQEIIKTFLSDMAETASQHNFEKHMDLISKEVEVFGVPGFETISSDEMVDDNLLIPQPCIS